METLSFIDAMTRVGARAEVATKHHARQLARIMRRKDRDEVMASGNLPPEKAVRVSINRAKEAYAIFAGDKLLMVCGVGLLNQGACPWMLTSDHVDTHHKTFWAASKVFVAQIRERYPLLMNMLHARNREVIGWAERLGFTISIPEPWGARGELFCRATMVTQRVILSGRSDEFSVAREVLGV